MLYKHSITVLLHYRLELPPIHLPVALMVLPKEKQGNVLTITTINTVIILLISYFHINFVSVTTQTLCSNRSCTVTSAPF